MLGTIGSDKIDSSKDTREYSNIAATGLEEIKEKPSFKERGSIKHKPDERPPGSI